MAHSRILELEENVDAHLKSLHRVKAILPVVEEIDALIPPALRSYYGQEDGGGLGEGGLYKIEVDVEGDHEDDGHPFVSCIFMFSVFTNEDFTDRAPRLEVELAFCDWMPGERGGWDAVIVRYLSDKAESSEGWELFSADPSSDRNSLYKMFLSEHQILPALERQLSREEARNLILQMIRCFESVKQKADARPKPPPSEGDDESDEADD